MLTRLLPRSITGFAMAPLCLLAACGDDAPPVDDARSASGEVLEGTISDAMLPLDGLRSQAPLAEKEAAEGAGLAVTSDEAEQSDEPVDTAPEAVTEAVSETTGEGPPAAEPSSGPGE